MTRIMKKDKKFVNLFHENTKEVFEKKKLIPIKILFAEKKDEVDIPPFTVFLIHFNFYMQT